MAQLNAWDALLTGLQTACTFDGGACLFDEKRSLLVARAPSFCPAGERMEVRNRFHTLCGKSSIAELSDARRASLASLADTQAGSAKELLQAKPQDLMPHINTNHDSDFCRLSNATTDVTPPGADSNSAQAAPASTAAPVSFASLAVSKQPDLDEEAKRRVSAAWQASRTARMQCAQIELHSPKSNSVHIESDERRYQGKRKPQTLNLNPKP